MDGYAGPALCRLGGAGQAGWEAPEMEHEKRPWEELHSEVTTAESRRRNAPPERISAYSRGSSQASGGLVEPLEELAADTSSNGHTCSDGHTVSSGRGLDVIARTRQRIREVRERERLERLREQEEASMRRQEQQQQHEQRMKRQESEKRRRRQMQRKEEELQASAQAEETRKAREHGREQEEKLKLLQKHAQARIKAEKEKAKEKRDQELAQKEEKGKATEEAQQKASEAMEAAKKRLIQKKKQEMAKKEEEESMQKLEAEYEQDKENDQIGEHLQRKAQERLRQRSEERRKQETQAKNREALQRLEREERQASCEKQLEQRRATAAQRAGSRLRREKDEEERHKREQEEQDRLARERKQLYRNPRSIAELKSHECPAPLTQQQRRAASQRRQAEQEKLRRYAEGLPAETVEDAKDGDPRGRSSASAPPNRARPPLLPSLERRKPEESRERDTGAQANREGGSRGSRRGSRGRSSISPSPSVVSLPDIETGLVAGSAQVAVVGLAPAGPASPNLEVLPALEAELPEAVEELASPSVAMQEPGASCDMFHSDQVAEKADASLAASIGSMNSVSGYVQLDEPDVHVRIQCSDDEFAVEIRTD